MAEIRSFPKPKREKLHGETYKDFIREVFARDGWRCRYCGIPKDLTPHHIIKRSQLGGDTLDNLLTLCLHCHSAVERNELKIEVINIVVRFIESKGDSK